MLDLFAFWRVKIRRAGLPARTRTFDNQMLAQQWARSIKTEIDSGLDPAINPTVRLTSTPTAARSRLVCVCRSRMDVGVGSRRRQTIISGQGGRGAKAVARVFERRPTPALKNADD